MATTPPPWESPAHHLLRRSPAVSDDLELLQIKPAAVHRYSSLRDILPSMAAINSPKPKWADSGPDVSIRNRLVKQAAKAYLRPMSTSSASTGGLFRRFWRCVADVVGFLCRSIIQVADGTFRLIGLRRQRPNVCLD